MFRYCYMITNFKFMIFSLFSTPKPISVLYFTLVGSILFVLLYVLLYLLTISSKLSISTFFWYWSHIIVNFALQGSNKSFSNNRFSFITCCIYFCVINPETLFHWSIVNSLPLSTHICLVCNYTHLKIFEKH